jgi:hypothetical protein
MTSGQRAFHYHPEVQASCGWCAVRLLFGCLWLLNEVLRAGMLTQ